ncbi:MAG: colanic acid biosynthesis glycosyltransferase WcaL [Nodularia sp. (in: Bacteria)]|nr:MAG: colanic acid biosynthesis glycosyltransferase WcaL [Nodularia sp. (in: cyanobacteria)]
MRIAIIAGRFPVISETFILNQITGLITRGHEVHIYASQPEDASKMHPNVEKYNLLQQTHYIPPIPNNYLWRFLLGMILLVVNFAKAPLVLLRSLNFLKYAKKAISLRILYEVIPLLKSQPYDIIHCQFGVFALDGMVYRDIGAIKGKLITSFRGFDISKYLQEHGEDIYNPLFTKGDFFLTNCEFFRQRAIKLGCNENKIIVHGSGIDCSRFPFKPRESSSDGKVQIVTTGRLVEKKGIEYGIRAIAKLAKHHANIEYKIIGDGILKAHFQELIAELNVTEKVKLLGWKNQPEIIEILNQAHIFIAPCITAADGNQDAPVNTLKEAMAMGLPVIGTLHGGIPELVEDGISGFLVPEQDADAIAAKLTYLIEHPEAWEPMGRAGRAYVEKHYDMHKLNDELVAIYQQVLLNNPPEFPEFFDPSVNPTYVS